MAVNTNAELRALGWNEALYRMAAAFITGKNFDDTTFNFPIGPVPAGATMITADSGNQANAAATATLAGVASKTTYITGFQITGTGATAVKVATVTVTGTITGTMNYTYVFVAGATTKNADLIVTFPTPVPASAVNTGIAVSCPSSGAGGTNLTVCAQGFQI